jgi:[ribosomal protein S5]-alanine N-acetyltransferase
MKITTKRLVLRIGSNKDIKDIIKNINNLNVSRWLTVVSYPYKRKDAKEFINKQLKESRKMIKENYFFSVELASLKKVIGGCSLRVNRLFKTGTIGYWLGESFWRQGYGSEILEALMDHAFNKLKLRRLEAMVFVGNPSSGLLLEKYGFKLEGLKRKAVICKADKKVKDEYIYGLLKEEYKKINKK